MRAFIDRFEGGKAVLLLGENEEIQIVLPRAWLPKKAAEGTVLRVDFTVDEQATQTAKDEIQALYNRLGDNP
jgi:hypothetical protein